MRRGIADACNHGDRKLTPQGHKRHFLTYFPECCADTITACTGRYPSATRTRGAKERFPRGFQDFRRATAGARRYGAPMWRAQARLGLAHNLRRDWFVARRLMVKHLAEIARIHPLAAAPAAVRQFALLRKRRVELLGDPAGERIVEFESVECGFADHASITRPREFGSGGNLGNIGARRGVPATFTGISTLMK